MLSRVPTCVFQVKGLGELAHAPRHKPAHLHRGRGGGLGNIDRAPGQRPHLGVLLALAQSLLALVRHVLDELARLARPNLDTRGQELAASHDGGAQRAQLVLGRQLRLGPQRGQLLQVGEQLRPGELRHGVGQHEPHAAVRGVAVHVREHVGAVLCLEAGAGARHQGLGPAAHLQEVRRGLALLRPRLQLQYPESLGRGEGADVARGGHEEDLDTVLQLEQLVCVLRLVLEVLGLEVGHGGVDLRGQVGVGVVLGLGHSAVAVNRPNLNYCLCFHFTLRNSRAALTGVFSVR